MDPGQDAYAEPDETLFQVARRGSESLRERLLELYLLYTTSKSFNASFYSDHLTTSIRELLRSSLDVEEFGLVVENPETGLFDVWFGDDRVMADAGEVSFRPGEGVTGRVVEQGEPLLIQDVRQDERFLHYKGEIPDIGGFLAVPMTNSEGRVFAVLNIHRRQANAFQANDKELFSAVALNLAPALERVLMYDEVREGAFFDDLTGLYNRRFFREHATRELTKAQRHDQTLSLLSLDIDHFKLVNDRLGHDFGDQLLRQLADTLKANVRESDLISRQGGEEIMVLLPETPEEGALRLAEKLRACIQERVHLDVGRNHQVGVTASIGVVTCPQDGTDLENLAQTVDYRMYRAKEAGRNRVVGGEGSEEEDEASQDRRRFPRFQAALCLMGQSGAGDAAVRSIEIQTKAEWLACGMADVGREGFSALLPFAPTDDGVYWCRAWLQGSEEEATYFRVRVCHVQYRKDEAQYFIGLRIQGDDAEAWESVYLSMIH